MAKEGLAGMRDELDAATRSRIDGQNGARVQRAWEVLRATGRGLAEWHDDTPPPALPLAQAEALVLRPEVAWLDTRITQRFDGMIAAGALQEARAALPSWSPRLPSSRAIGAPELISYLQGKSTLSEATLAAVLASRRYAKRQRTWFRSRMAGWREIPCA
jgi:tRNA dimethylallyltransferase